MTTISYLDTTYEYNPYTKQIEAKGVNKTNIVSEINLSTEGITISGDKVEINWTTTFSTGYDPSAKIDTGDAAADINANVTTIDWGKITTNSLTATQVDVDDLFAETITATWTITWATLKTSWWSNRAEMAWSWFTIYNSSDNKSVEMSPIGSGSLKFYDDTYGVIPTSTVTSKHDTTTYSTNVVGVYFNNNVMTNDLFLAPFSNLWFLQSGWIWDSRLYSNWTNLYFRDKDWTTTTLV